MDIVQIEGGLLQAQPGIQHVHVKDVDQARIDHVHVEESILADVFEEFDGGFRGCKVRAGFTGQCTPNEKFHAEGGLA